MKALTLNLNRVLQFTAVLLLAALLQSCGHDGDDSPPLPSLSSSVTVAGAPILSDAKMAGGTALVLANTDGSPKTLLVRYSDGTTEQLLSDPNDKTHFWLPIVTEAKKGTLTANQDGKAVAALDVSISPYQTSAKPGAVALNFLVATRVRQQTSIDSLAGNAAHVDALSQLTKLQSITVQQIAWVSEAMTKGSASVDDPFTNSKRVLDQEGLKQMDQVTMRWLARTAAGTAPLASSLKDAREALLAVLPSATAATLTQCNLTRPPLPELGTAVPSPAENQAWCDSQLQDIIDAENVANGIALGADILKLGGAALSIVNPPLGAALMWTGVVIGAQSDLINVIVSMNQGKYSQAAAQTLIASVKVATSLYVSSLKFLAPLIPNVGSKYAETLVEVLKDRAGGSLTNLIDALSRDIEKAITDAENPPVSPPPADIPPLSSASFGISKPLACTLNIDGSARLTGQLSADLAPGEQITIVSNTSRFYTGPNATCGGSDTYVVPEGALPNNSFPSYENAQADCVPPTGLELNPVYFAVCHNPESSTLSRSIAVNINTSVSANIMRLSPDIIVFLCRATTLNLNKIETVTKARAAATIHQPVTCTGAPNSP